MVLEVLKEEFKIMVIDVGLLRQRVVVVSVMLYSGDLKQRPLMHSSEVSS